MGRNKISPKILSGFREGFYPITLTEIKTVEKYGKRDNLLGLYLWLEFTRLGRISGHSVFRRAQLPINLVHNSEPVYHTRGVSNRVILKALYGSVLKDPISHVNASDLLKEMRGKPVIGLLEVSSNNRSLRVTKIEAPSENVRLSLSFKYSEILGRA